VWSCDSAKEKGLPFIGINDFSDACLQEGASFHKMGGLCCDASNGEKKSYNPVNPVKLEKKLFKLEGVYR